MSITKKITVYDNFDDPNIYRRVGVRLLHYGRYVYVCGERWAVRRDGGEYVLDYRAPA